MLRLEWKQVTLVFILRRRCIDYLSRLCNQPCARLGTTPLDFHGWLREAGIHLQEVSNAIARSYYCTDNDVYSQYWLWCPVIAPILGAQFGAGFYDIFLYNGDDSIVNKW